MDKIYIIVKEHYEDGVLRYTDLLGYVKTEEEAQKIVAEWDDYDVYYEETSPY